MLTYDEFKQAIDNGYIVGDTVAIVRKTDRFLIMCCLAKKSDRRRLWLRK